MNYWLMKSEPNVYSIGNLAQDQQTIWDGVRNYQARNYLRSMNPGDLAFFYHSNTAPPGIVGLMQVIKSGIVDPSQFDPHNDYYDPRATPANPRWQTVLVEFVQQFPAMITLETLRNTFSPDELWVVRQGNRLSVMPIAEDIAQRLLSLAKGI